MNLQLSQYKSKPLRRSESPSAAKGVSFSGTILIIEGEDDVGSTARIRRNERIPHWIKAMPEKSKDSCVVPRKSGFSGCDYGDDWRSSLFD